MRVQETVEISGEAAGPVVHGGNASLIGIEASSAEYHRLGTRRSSISAVCWEWYCAAAIQL